MKYLLILSWLGLGGSERQAVNLAEYLKNNGQDVTVLGICEAGRVNEICAQKGIKCIAFPPRNSIYSLTYKFLHKTGIRPLTNEEIALLGLIHDLKAYIKKNGFDVCISYCTTANTVLGNIKREYPGPVCIWRQGDAGIYDNLEGLQIPAVRAVDEIVSNGITPRDWIKSAYGRESRIIYNGVITSPPQSDRHAWRDKLHVTDEEIVCTMIANLTSAKDHMFLLKVWDKLLASGYRYKLVFAGDFGTEYDGLKSYADKNGLDGQVIFAGHVSDVYGLLEASDICIFGAKSEGSPNGIIEGCTVGLPVVSTGLPEIMEVVSEENIPYLYKAGDVDEAAGLVVRLADNPEIRRSIGEANRIKVRKMFDPEKNFRAIMDLAEECVRHGKNGIRNDI